MATTRGFTRFAADCDRAAADLDMPDVYQDLAGLVASGIGRTAPRRTGALARSPRPTGAPNLGRVMLPLIYSGVQNYGWPAHNIEGTRFVERARDQVQRQLSERLDRGVQDVLNDVRGA